MGRFPEVLVLGGQKCGSTALYEYLVRHPSVHPCREKSPDYFTFQWPSHLQSACAQGAAALDARCSDESDAEDNPVPLWLRVLTMDCAPVPTHSAGVLPPHGGAAIWTALVERYAALFPERSASCKSTEASATNCFPMALRRIHRLYVHSGAAPPLCVLLVRDPIERARSHFRFLRSLRGAKGADGERWREQKRKRYDETFAAVMRSQMDLVRTHIDDAHVRESDVEHFDACVHDALRQCCADIGRAGGDASDAVSFGASVWREFALWHSHVLRSLYWAQYEEAVRLFGHEQVLVLESAELRACPTQLTEQVLRRVGFTASECEQLPELGGGASQRYMVTQTPSSDDTCDPSATVTDELRHELRLFFSPHDERLAASLGRRLSWMQ